MNLSQENPPTEVSNDAVVIHDQLVTLWRDGVTIEASSRSMQVLQSEGWLLGSPESLPSLAAEINLLAQQVALNTNRLMDALRVEKVYNPEDDGIYASALVAKNLLDQKLEEYINMIHAVYPRSQGVGVTVTHPDTQEQHVIDPSQVAVIDPEGTLRALDAETAARLGWRKV